MHKAKLYEILVLKVSLIFTLSLNASIQGSCCFFVILLLLCFMENKHPLSYSSKKEKMNKKNLTPD